MLEIINKNENGVVFRCKKCQKVHLEFNNFNLNFSAKEYEQFSHYIQEIDGEYWELVNKHSPLRRKICIPIRDDSTCIVLNKDELKQLQQLLSTNLETPITEKLINRFTHSHHLN